MASYDIAYIEYDIKAKRIQQALRKIFLYKRSDMDGLRDHLARFNDSLLSSDRSHSQLQNNFIWLPNCSLGPSKLNQYISTTKSVWAM